MWGFARKADYGTENTACVICWIYAAHAESMCLFSFWNSQYRSGGHPGGFTDVRAALYLSDGLDAARMDTELE